MPLPSPAALARILTRARVPQIVLGLIAVVLMARTERFFTPGTLGSILSLAGLVGVLAAGQAFVLIGGGFDLSQGAAMGLCAAVAALLATKGLSPPLTVAATLGTGLLLGSLNGWFVAKVRTNPFVTTLSTLLIFRSATFALLGGRTIPGVTAFNILNDGPTLAGTLVPWRAFLFPILAAIAWVVLRRTVFGQYVYAVGGNAQASRLAGIATTRIRVATFALSGLAAGIAAIQILAWVRVSKPDTGTGYELDSIAACIVGGISLQGGAGSVVGAALGCLLLQSLATLITMSGFPDEYRTLVTGAVILIFAATDALSRDPQER